MPYIFTIDSGSLPTGLSMNSSGLVTGTASAAGTYNWVVRATDTVGNFDTHPDSAIITMPANPKVLLAEINTTTIRVSNDGGLDGFTAATYNAGGIAGSNGMVATSGSWIYRLRTTGGRISKDGGSVWQDITGMDINTPCGMITTDTEIIVYGLSNHLCVSPISDGINFTTRALPTTSCVGMVKRGTTLVGIRGSNSAILLSVDSGLTWSTFNTGVGTSFQSTDIVDTGTNFIVIGQGGGFAQSQYSPSGANGTWTNVNVAGFPRDIMDRAEYHQASDLLIEVSNGSPNTHVSSNDGVSFSVGTSTTPISVSSMTVHGKSVYAPNGAGSVLVIARVLPSGNGSVLRTVDGTSWSTVYSGGPLGSLAVLS